MRLATIERPQGLRDALFFALVRVMSGHRVPDVMRALRFRAEMFGAPMGEVFQEALRGPSEWSVGERELFAAWVSKKNECEF